MENKKKFNMSILDNEQIISEKNDYEIIYKQEFENLNSKIIIQNSIIDQQQQEIADLRCQIFSLKQYTKNIFEYISSMYIHDGYLHTDYEKLCYLRQYSYDLNM